MIIESQFKPVWWLKNNHLQTSYASLRHPHKPPEDDIERVELPDGDFLDLIWSRANLPDDAPLIVILHGLTGSLHSSYVGRFMHAFNQKGWRAVLVHFRGAGAEINRLPRAYHSGDTADLDFVICTLHQREPETKKAVVGVSLGGNVLLKWLGERGSESKIKTAVALSVPFVLSRVADHMNFGFARLYQRGLIKQMQVDAARKANYLTNPPDALKKAAECDCFWTFDEKVTAPLNGFRGVHEYYRLSSSRQYLRAIALPTLIIHAKDDPFMPAKVVPNENELSEHVTLELAEHGGHMGFVSGNKFGMPVFWLDQRVPEYIEEQFGKVS